MQLWISALAILVASPLCCEAASAIMGRALDPQGKVISGASVRLEGGRYSKSTRTNSQGQFQFESLTPGSYTIAAEFSGFSPISREVAIQPGEAAVVDLTFLNLKKQTQSLVITSSTRRRFRPVTCVRITEVCRP